MKKFADDANSRERRWAEEVREREREARQRDRASRQREKDLLDMAVEREKEIRADMRQLAASEARVAALEQQLKDQASLPLNPQGDIWARRERNYFPDHPSKSQAMSWCPSPVMRDHRVTSVPASVPRYDWHDFSLKS